MTLAVRAARLTPLLLGCALGSLGCRPSGCSGTGASGSAAQSASATGRGARPAPELTVPHLRSGDSLRIDGELDEGAWAYAADTGAFVNVGTGQPASPRSMQGRAKLLWDEGSLFAAIEVKDAKVRGGWPDDAKDPHLWEKDTIELMLDPDGDGDNKDYYELQVNPQNLVFDTRYDDYNQPNGGGRGPFGHEEWSSAVESAVLIQGTLDDDSDRDEGYRVELRVPWASFAKAKRSPPQPGDQWRMNLYAMQDNGGVAWSPILGQGNFHRARRFGRVVWGRPPAP